MNNPEHEGRNSTDIMWHWKAKCTRPMTFSMETSRMAKWIPAEELITENTWMYLKITLRYNNVAYFSLILIYCQTCIHEYLRRTYRFNTDSILPPFPLSILTMNSLRPKDTTGS